jgi:CRISPR-associated protein Cas1
MPTVYVDRKSALIGRKDGRLLITTEPGVVVGFPMQMVDRVIIQSPCRIESAALAELGRRGVPVAIAGTTRGSAAAVLVSAMARDGFRRLAQTRAYLNAAARLRLAALVVRAKLRRQRLVLNQNRAGAAEFALRKGVAALTAALARRAAWTDLTALLGAEGAAARAYFQALSSLFAPALAFSGRNRRPPRDPVNACLSLGYTLLHARLTAHLAAEGFDPFIGYLHEPSPGRASLACDFVELERFRIDRLVLHLFRTRTLRLEHFRSRPPACLLGKAGRRIFYEAWEAQAGAADRGCIRAIRLLARWLDSTAEAPA